MEPMDPVDRYMHGDDQASFDPASRSLCPDELCVGLIGQDGRCKVCGKTGTPPAAGSPDAQDAPDSSDRSDAEASNDASDLDAATATEASATAAPESDPAFQDRALCSDDSCIGLLGPDGRCKECGKAA